MRVSVWPSTVDLTEREAAALRLFDVQGYVNEGMLFDTWPEIRRPRLISKALERKALVVFEEWTGRFDDGGGGYDLSLTDFGRAVLDALGSGEAAKAP